MALRVVRLPEVKLRLVLRTTVFWRNAAGRKRGATKRWPHHQVRFDSNVMPAWRKFAEQKKSRSGSAGRDRVYKFTNQTARETFARLLKRHTDVAAISEDQLFVSRAAVAPRDAEMQVRFT